SAPPSELHFPFCVRLDGENSELPKAAEGWLETPGYIRVGRPLVLHGERGRELRVAGSDAVVEDGPTLEDGYGQAMRRRLAVPLPDHPWYRMLAAPVEPMDASVYSVWLRKLVLQTALRAPAQAPLLFVDASAVWSAPSEREAWLAATRRGMQEGIQQFYASQNIRLREEDVDVILHST